MNTVSATHPDSIGVGAPVHEIEITPAMIGAGALGLSRALPDEYSLSSAEFFAEIVLIAALGSVARK